VPDVTVLMAVYNGERHLRAAIDSVLAQTLRDFEFVIVDDGSTDGSQRIVESYEDARIRLLIHDRNRGLPAALNTGLAAARGELVARQDQDDLSDARRLESQAAFLQARPQVALLGTQAFAADESGRRVGVVNRPLSSAAIRWHALVDNPFIHTSVMFRRSIVREELRGYDASLAHCEDYDLWTRLLERHDGRNLDARLVTYRVRRGSMMSSVEGAGEGDAYRSVFQSIVGRVIARGLHGAVGASAARDAALLAKYALGVPAADLEAFLDAWHRLRAAFEARNPGARGSADFRRTLAWQLDAIAARVRPPSRRAALRVYASGLRRDPALARSLPWGRALALAVLGPAGRRWLHRARGYAGGVGPQPRRRAAGAVGR